MDDENTDVNIVRTRVAPSPTGFLHIGGIEIALFNYAFAKKYGGKFLLRLEDTDRERLVEGASEDIFAMLKAFGLNYDEGPDVGGDYGPYVQSERVELYQKYAHQLVESGNAYYCFCSQERLDNLRKEQIADRVQPRYDGACRSMPAEEAKSRIDAGESYVVRLKVPENKKIEQTNMFGKPFEFNSKDVDDAILLKSDGYPTYYLGVVVDDHLMKISHVWKGLEWQSSDPKLLLLYDAFGWVPPKFGYLPLMLDPDGGKLSKRKGAVSARSFLEAGYLPEAILNYIMLMGWNPGDNREIFTLDQFIQEFDLKKVNPVSAVFDRTKLLWMNGVWLRMLSDEGYYKKFITWIKTYSNYQNDETKKYYEQYVNAEMFQMMKAISLEKERAKTFQEMAEGIRFLFEEPKADLTDPKLTGLQIKGKKAVLQRLFIRFEKYDDDSQNWTHETWESDVRGVADEVKEKHGDVFMLLRFAITGSSVSPELFSTMQLLGKKKALERITNFSQSLN